MDTSGLPDRLAPAFQGLTDVQRTLVTEKLGGDFQGRTFTQIREDVLKEGGVYSGYKSLLKNISSLQQQTSRGLSTNEELAQKLQEASSLKAFFENLRIRERAPGFFGWLGMVFSKIFGGGFLYTYRPNEHRKSLEQLNREIDDCAQDVFKEYTSTLHTARNEEGKYTYEALQGRGIVAQSLSLPERRLSDVFVELRRQKDLVPRARIEAERREAEQVEAENMAPEVLVVDNVQGARKLIAQYALVRPGEEERLEFLVRKPLGEGSTAGEPRYNFQGGASVEGRDYVPSPSYDPAPLRQAKANKDLYERAQLLQQKGVPHESYVSESPTQEIPGTYWIEPQGRTPKLCVRTADNALKQYELDVTREGVSLRSLSVTGQPEGEPIQKNGFQELFSPGGILETLQSLPAKRASLQAEEARKREENAVRLQQYEAQHETLRLPNSTSSAGARALIEQYGLLSKEESQQLVFLEKVETTSTLGAVGAFFRFISRTYEDQFRTPEGRVLPSSEEQKLAFYEQVKESNRLLALATKLDQLCRQCGVPSEAFSREGKEAMKGREAAYRNHYWIEVPQEWREPLPLNFYRVDEGDLLSHYSLSLSNSGINAALVLGGTQQSASLVKRTLGELDCARGYRPLGITLRKEQETRAALLTVLEGDARESREAGRSLNNLVRSYTGESLTGYQLVQEGKEFHIHEVKIDPGQVQDKDLGPIQVEVGGEPPQATFRSPRVLDREHLYTSFQEWLTENRMQSLQNVQQTVKNSNDRQAEFVRLLVDEQTFLRTEGAQDHVTYAVGAEPRTGWQLFRSTTPGQCVLKEVRIQPLATGPGSISTGREVAVQIRSSLEGVRLFRSSDPSRLLTPDELIMQQGGKSYTVVKEEAQAALSAERKATIDRLIHELSASIGTARKINECASQAATFVSPAMVDAGVVPRRCYCLTSTPSQVELRYLTWDREQKKYTESSLQVITCKKPDIYTVGGGQELSLQRLKESVLEGAVPFQEFEASLRERQSDYTALLSSLRESTTEAISERAQQNVAEFFVKMPRESLWYLGKTKDILQPAGLLLGRERSVIIPMVWKIDSTGIAQPMPILYKPDGSLTCGDIPIPNAGTPKKSASQLLDELRAELAKRGPSLEEAERVNSEMKEASGVFEECVYPAKTESEKRSILCHDRLMQATMNQQIATIQARVQQLGKPIGAIFRFADRPPDYLQVYVDERGNRTANIIRIDVEKSGPTFRTSIKRRELSGTSWGDLTPIRREALASLMTGSLRTSSSTALTWEEAKNMPPPSAQPPRSQPMPIRPPVVPSQPPPFVLPTRREELPIPSSALPPKKEEAPPPPQFVTAPRVEEEKPREKQESPPPPPPPRVPPSSPRVPLSSKGVREERPAVPSSAALASDLLEPEALSQKVREIRETAKYNNSLGLTSDQMDTIPPHGPYNNEQYGLLIRYLRSNKAKITPTAFDITSPNSGHYLYEIKTILQAMSPQEKQIMRNLLGQEGTLVWVTRTLNVLGS